MQKNYHHDEYVISSYCDNITQYHTSAHGGAHYLPAAKKRYAYRFFKRLFDIVTSALVLVVFGWLYLIIACVVKFSDGGRVFFKHERVGLNGKRIYITKFRSMRPDAEKLENALTPEQYEQYKTEYKLEDDPRITKVGAFLRKTSLDEIPQVWDIFVGRLSVIGPRPVLEDELISKYGPDAAKLVSVKPGMVGWWGVNGRSNVTYESGRRQQLELYYVDHCSFWFDAKVFFKAIISVLRRDGAK